MDVIVRNIDGEVYKRLKAEAALRGLTASRAIEEAIKAWLGDKEKAVYDETDVNNDEYLKMKHKLLEDYRGKYVVFCHGKFMGSANCLEEAGKLVLEAGAKKALITKVGANRPAGGEWLWSSLEV
ncbi:MAG: hypothetical protein AOA65_1684 [Candidatus Bathyarchaeota archaeon BA1]|nr:MAG: hypothetical protein AOA65_1684 [Candidatus Bathyarchaeota archaeon BA1]